LRHPADGNPIGAFEISTPLAIHFHAGRSSMNFYFARNCKGFSFSADKQMQEGLWTIFLCLRLSISGSQQTISSIR
jgi:hypothetical protein